MIAEVVTVVDIVVVADVDVVFVIVLVIDVVVVIVVPVPVLVVVVLSVLFVFSATCFHPQDDYVINLLTIVVKNLFFHSKPFFVLEYL